MVRDSEYPAAALRAARHGRQERCLTIPALHRAGGTHRHQLVDALGRGPVWRCPFGDEEGPHPPCDDASHDDRDDAIENEKVDEPVQPVLDHQYIQRSAAGDHHHDREGHERGKGARGLSERDTLAHVRTYWGCICGSGVPSRPGISRLWTLSVMNLRDRGENQ